MPSVQQLVIDVFLDTWKQGQLPLGGVCGAQPTERHKTWRDFPLTCVTVPICHLSDSVVVVVEQKISILQRAVCKELHLTSV